MDYYLLAVLFGLALVLVWRDGRKCKCPHACNCKH